MKLRATIRRQRCFRALQVLAVTMAFAMTFSLFSCGSDDDEQNPAPSPDPSAMLDSLSKDGFRTSPLVAKAKFRLSDKDWTFSVGKDAQTQAVFETRLDGVEDLLPPIHFRLKTEAAIPNGTELVWQAFSKAPLKSSVSNAGEIEQLFAGSLLQDFERGRTAFKAKGLKLWRFLIVGPKGQRPDLGHVEFEIHGRRLGTGQSTLKVAGKAGGVSPPPAIPKLIPECINVVLSAEKTFKCQKVIRADTWSNPLSQPWVEFVVSGVSDFPVPSTIKVDVEKSATMGSLGLVWTSYTDDPGQSDSFLDTLVAGGFSDVNTWTVNGTRSDIARFWKVRLEAPNKTPYDLGRVTFEVRPIDWKDWTD
jgi:hypothetical protein